jgi:DNA-binding response OmpR family regulator
LEVVADGGAALFRAAGESWDLLIVDRMLPGLDGLALVRTLRAASVSAAVLFLTTMGGFDDHVTGLNAGADDYLVKPFAFAELSARIGALSRRPRTTQPDTTIRGFSKLNEPAAPLDCLGGAVRSVLNAAQPPARLETPLASSSSTRTATGMASAYHRNRISKHSPNSGR